MSAGFVFLVLQSSSWPPYPGAWSENVGAQLVMSEAQASSTLHLVEAGPARRLAAGFIDVLFGGGVISVVINVGFDLAGRAGLTEVITTTRLLALVAYFVACEAIWGRTLGKWATGTRVVQQDGSALSFVQACIRCGARFVPFGAASLLGVRPWRDRWSRSRVIVDAPSSRERKGFAHTALLGVRPLVAPMLSLFFPGLGHIVMRKFVQGGVLFSLWAFLMFTPWPVPITCVRILAAVLITAQMWGHRLGWLRMYSDRPEM